MPQIDRGVKPMNFVRLAISALILATFPATLLARSAQGSESGKDQGLIAALSVREATQCVDARYKDIEANVAFMNTSNHDIVIKKGGGQNVTVFGLFGTRTLRPLLSAWMSTSDQGGAAASTQVIVHPGDTFAHTVKLRLNTEILSQPGFYEIQVSYSAFRRALPTTERNAQNYFVGETNGAIIQVRECGESVALRHGSESMDTVDSRDEVISCQIPVPRARRDASFDVVYKFETKDGKPVNITKVKNDFLPDDKFVACISHWTVPSMSQGVATFSWKPVGGWTTSVSGEGTDTVDPRSSNLVLTNPLVPTK